MATISIVARPIDAWRNKVVKKVSDTLIRIPRNGIKRIYDYCDNLIYKKVYQNMEDALAFEEHEKDGIEVSNKGKFIERAYMWNQISKRPLTLENDGELVSKEELQSEIQGFNPDITFEDSVIPTQSQMDSEPVSENSAQNASSYFENEDLTIPLEPNSFESNLDNFDNTVFSQSFSEGVNTAENVEPVLNDVNTENVEPVSNDVDTENVVPISEDFDEDFLGQIDEELDSYNNVVSSLFDYDNPEFDVNSLMFEPIQKVEEATDDIFFDEIMSEEVPLVSEEALPSEEVEVSNDEVIDINSANREYLESRGITDTDIIIGKNGECNAMDYLLGMMRELDEEKMMSGENSSHTKELEALIEETIKSVKPGKESVEEELDNAEVKDPNREYLESRGITDTDIVDGNHFGDNYNAMDYLLGMMRELDEEKMISGENSDRVKELEGLIEEKINSVRPGKETVVDDISEEASSMFADYENVLVENLSGVEEETNDNEISGDYVTRAEYDALLDRIDALEKKYDSIMKKESNALKRERKKRKEAEKHKGEVLKENESLTQTIQEQREVIQKQQDIIERTLSEREEMIKIIEGTFLEDNTVNDFEKINNNKKI